MENTVLALLAVLSSLAHGLTLEAPPVFYVKPTVVPTTECPSDDYPCHSLQYYANHSNFTNNSRFLFLKGKHHLDSVVTISNVVNLSLVGLSPGVEIFCMSTLSGFHVEKFKDFNIKNMTITRCIGFENTSISLLNGSDMSLNDVTISWGLVVATNVVGTFSIFASTFILPLQEGGDMVIVKYSLCNRPSYLSISKNKMKNDAGLSIDMNCSNIQVLINNSWLSALRIEYSVVTNNSILVSNTTFGGVVFFNGNSNDGNLHYGLGFKFLTITKTTFNPSYFMFDFTFADIKNCTAIIEDSNFLGQSIIGFQFFYGTSKINNDTTVIVRNTSFVGRNIYLGGPLIRLWRTYILFVNCTFEKIIGGSSIGAEVSKVIFQGNNTFRNNSAPVGAGVNLVNNSYIFLEPHTHILFEGNHAEYVGGAIYSDSSSCFYHVMDSARSKNNTVQVNFAGNTAQLAGSSIYGDVQTCCPNSSCSMFHNIFITSNTETDPSAIASDPKKICLCDANKFQPNCTVFNDLYTYTHAFPGQLFPVRLAVVGGQFNGVVIGAVRAYLDHSSSINAAVVPHSQTSDIHSCKNFNYSIYSNFTGTNATFKLTLEQYYYEQVTTQNVQSIYVTVNLLDCPLGFFLLPVIGSCVCDLKFSRNRIECNIANQSFSRPANTWIGFINESSSTSSNSGVLFHSHCPIGYCLPHNVSVTSSTSDNQCEPHRTGLLCGECEDGYSLTLGDQKCRKCSNTYLLLVLPFAVAGLLLVAVLFALNLTVTEGSLNGLIFYANVMAMNHTTLFPGETTFPYAFLAWLNLDLGISTCLFNGMDGYVETWLQFVFPVYLWTIILMVVLFYKKFRANRLGGKNAVKVLATLLLLSYTKLQRTVVTILSFTWLEYPDGVVHYVWLYDANVEFFKGKHLYLGIAGILILVFLIVPYTLCLVFFQRLQACSGHRLFQWVNKLKPVFDAYAGPYKDKYRFWTGMLLAVRTLLIILFTTNTGGSADFTLVIILVVSGALLLANTNGSYFEWPKNYLESFFYLQLTAFAGGFFYARHNNGSITTVAYTSIGLTLIVLLAILGYHVFCRISALKHHLNDYVEITDEYLAIDQDREE